jgi:S1-C subfamily serine protease
VSQDGVIATAEHVITANSCACKKILVDGLEATIIAKDKATDTAIIKVNKEFKYVSSIVDRPLKLTEDVVVVGWPVGKGLFSYVSATKGHISGMAGFKDDLSEFRFTAPIHGGNSGGPIVSMKDGKVVGLVSSSYIGRNDEDRMDTQNLNFGKRSSILRAMMNAKRISASTKDIAEDDILDHYIKATKYISCIY